MPSAIATTIIFPGAAVSHSKDNATLAGSASLASHIAMTGAVPSGVVTMTANGPVFLDDWTLATGSPGLKTGATYFVGQGGKLVLSGSQPVGIAVSPTTLSVTIQSQNSDNAPDTTEIEAQIETLQTAISKLVAGGSVPRGGTIGQGLQKTGQSDYSADWVDGIPYASIVKYGP